MSLNYWKSQHKLQTFIKVIKFCIEFVFLSSHLNISSDLMSELHVSKKKIINKKLVSVTRVIHGIHGIHGIHVFMLFMKPLTIYLRFRCSSAL